MARWTDILRLRLRSLIRRGAVDRDLDRELRFHLEEHVAELVAEGHAPEEARRLAMRAFGPVASITEECRDKRRLNAVHNLTQDVRYAIRSLVKQPLLLAAASASIALGVGANLAIFGLANSLLLSAPSAFRPDRLVHIRTTNGSHTSYPVWRELHGAGVMAGIAGFSVEESVNWRGTDASVPITPLIVTSNYFDVVGVPMALGRGFTSLEADAGSGARLAVVSHGFWTRRLGGSPSIIGSSLTLNGESYTVLGVTPSGLRSLPGYGIVPEVWIPMSRSLLPDLDSVRASHLQMVGRLYDDQALDTGWAALSTVGNRVGRDLGAPEAAGIRLVTPVGGFWQINEFKEIALFFGALLIVTMLVLAIACANVAGLLLARGTARRKEIALRLALGASRGRIVQQLLTEGVVLACAGTVAGVALTAAAGPLFSRITLPVPLPLELHLTFDTRMVWLATALVFASGLLSSLVPALQATRPSVMPALKQETLTYLHKRFTLRNLLVTGQIAVSVLLLVMTALFLRNLALAHTLSPEFDADRALVAQITFVEGRQGTRAAPSVEGIVDRVRSMPGVEAAAFTRGVPLSMYTGRTGTRMRIEGHDAPMRVDFENHLVSPGYFAAMGIDLLHGRDFGPADRLGASQAVIVNQEFVRRYFDGRSPIGLHLFMPTENEPVPAEVVGVAADSKYETIGEARRAAVYEPYLQRRGSGRISDRLVHVIVRTAGPPLGSVAAVRDAILQMDSSAAVTVEPMTTTLAIAFLPSRIGAALVGLLGALGAVLAMIGLYGVVSYAVTRRTAEIGIRLALGASRGDVVRLVLSDGGVLVATGLLIGLGLALLVTRPLAAFLVADLPASDPVSFAGSAVLLLVTSLVASWSPARRATRVAPASALRAE